MRGVVATSALELGIDIGALDAAVLAGYPGTIASARQQMGRAGRRQGSSIGVLVAGAGAMDQYILTHPEWLLARSPEHARINPDNEVILARPPGLRRGGNAHREERAVSRQAAGAGG